MSAAEAHPVDDRSPSPGGRWAAASPSREIVARAQGGDQSAFAALYAHYRDPIWTYLFRLFGNEDDADEFVQDTFLEAYCALPATSADLRVGPWLYRIAANVALDAFRHRALVRWESLDRAFGTFATALARSQKHWGDRDVGEEGPRVRRHGHKLVDQDRRENPEQAAIDADVAVRVRAVLARLPARHRACLELREYQELSYDEIATRLRTTRPAVKALLFRARAEFRHHWRAEELRQSAGTGGRAADQSGPVGATGQPRTPITTR